MPPQPTATESDSTTSRFANMRIGSKLALILLIPLVVLSGVVAVRLVDSTMEAQRIGETADVVDLTRQVSTVINTLQTERHRMAVEIYGAELELEEDQRGQQLYANAIDESDEAIDDLESTRASFDADNQILDQLGKADKPLDRLGTVRNAELEEESAVYLTVYDAAVSRLIQVLDRSVDLADTAELSRYVRAATLLVSADQASEQLRVLVLQQQDGEALGAAYRQFMTQSITRAQTMQEYRRVGGEAVFEAGGLGGGAARTANVFESTLATTRTDESIEVDHSELMKAYNARHEATNTEVGAALETAGDLARNLQTNVITRVLLETAILLATVAVAVTATLWLGRPVIRGLRQLRDSARRIAYEELPTAVTQMGEKEGLAGLSPSEFADQTAAPTRTQGAAELVEVGQAFDDVHHEAIRVAAEQALLRVHIGSMFVQLARRGHSLTGRLTATLDEAERDEQDPNRLQRLFKLDHLVALLGRANDSLLVLGGASAARVRTADEKLVDVLTAAQSHTEHYTRINVGAMDERVRVRAKAVEDVVQIMAELMDNATKYSQHSTQTIAHVLGDRAVVQIQDNGIGIDAERLSRLNARLSSRASLDLEALQSMGLTVVGHLAMRHGIEISLKRSREGGTIAEVALPDQILSYGPDVPSPELEPAARQLDQEPTLFDTGAAPTQPAAPLDDAGAVLPIIHFEWQAIHADKTLQAGASLPQREQSAIDETSGLPRRQPQSQLVPGAVAPTADRPDGPRRRDPEAVGATYDAFARGLFGDSTGS